MVVVACLGDEISTCVDLPGLRLHRGETQAVATFAPYFSSLLKLSMPSTGPSENCLAVFAGTACTQNSKLM